MNDPLAIYLHDHLAGADFAVDLLQAMSRGDIQNPGSDFVDSLLVEVDQDRDTLRQLVDKVSSTKPLLKEVSAWIAEKANRLKLASEHKDLGEFQALEFIALGISGKLALWRALQQADPLDARLRGMNFEELIERAKAQHARVEERRLSVAMKALACKSS